VDDIRQKFAVKNGFHEVLKQVLIGDSGIRRYIRAFFRQNLTYNADKTKKIVSKRKSRKARPFDQIESLFDEDSENEVILEDESHDRVFAKVRKFFGKINQNTIQDLLYSQDSSYFFFKGQQPEECDNNEEQGYEEIDLSRERSHTFGHQERNHQI